MRLPSKRHQAATFSAVDSMAILRILCTEIDVFDQLRGLQTPEALFGDHQHFPDHRYRPIDPLVALGGIGLKPEGREG